jgi:hypothetical protein
MRGLASWLARLLGEGAGVGVGVIYRRVAGAPGYAENYPMILTEAHTHTNS